MNRPEHDAADRPNSSSDPDLRVPAPPPVKPEADFLDRYKYPALVVGMALAAVGLSLGIAYAHYSLGHEPHRVVKMLIAAFLVASFLVRPDWAMIIVPFAFPFITWLPVSPVPGLNAVNLLFGSMLLGWAGRSVYHRIRFLDPSPWNVPLGLFIAWMTFEWLRAAVLSERAGSAYFFGTLQQFWSGIVGVLLFFVLYNAIRTPAQVRRMAFLFCVAAGLGLVGLLQESAGFGGGRRVSGGLGQENEAAAFFSIGALFALGMLGARYRGIFKRGLILASVAAASAAAILPASRGALVGFAAGALPQAIRGGIVWVLVLALLVVSFVLWAPDYVMERITETQEAATSEGDRYDSLNESGGGRLEYWGIALQIIEANPLIGVGWNGMNDAMEPYLGRARPPHNLYLEMAGEAGVPAVLLFLWMFFIPLRKSRVLLSKPGFPRAMALGYSSAIICFLVANIFGGRYFTFSLSGSIGLLTALLYRTIQFAETEEGLSLLSGEAVREEGSRPGPTLSANFPFAARGRRSDPGRPVIRMSTLHRASVPHPSNRDKGGSTTVQELQILKGTGADRDPALNRPMIPISQPTLPPFEAYAGPLREVFERRQITNERWVRELETRAAEYLGCAEVVALANATSGLVLMAKLLGLSGEVCLPTFTFPATLHALLWNGLKPRLVDSDPDTFNIDPDSLEQALHGGAKAVVPVYIFGNSPDWDRLNPILAKHSLACYTDAAHALGTRWGTRMAGNFGSAEIFSLAPTKVTVAGEGGLVATNDESLAGELRIARNYGNPGDYDCVLAGLNARMSELHALLATLCLQSTEEAIATRHRLVGEYRDGMRDLPGISFQTIDPRCRTTYNYVAVRIDGERFGLTNRELYRALAHEGIQSRIYFAPPLHRQTRFVHLFQDQGPFPGAERVLDEVLCLPLYTHMDGATLERVVHAVRACHDRAEEVRQALRDEGVKV